jgi:hypothetical protein
MLKFTDVGRRYLIQLIILCRVVLYVAVSCSPFKYVKKVELSGFVKVLCT